MPIYAVSQVTSHLRALLEGDDLLADVWIGGEVANVTRAASGHAYFTLRDEMSQLRCVMFRQRSRGMQHLVSGAAVIVHGRVSIYAQRGEVQLVADVAQPEGVGELQMRLEQLKLKLESEGLFDQSRKRGLPRFPQRIGVVTSPSGAVWHDIQTVVGRRYPIAELVLAPTQVQGGEATAHIVAAFDALDEAPATDVVILARGGRLARRPVAFQRGTGREGRVCLPRSGDKRDRPRDRRNDIGHGGRRAGGHALRRRGAGRTERGRARRADNWRGTGAARRREGPCGNGPRDGTAARGAAGPHVPGLGRSEAARG